MGFFRDIEQGSNAESSNSLPLGKMNSDFANRMNSADFLYLTQALLVNLSSFNRAQIISHFSFPVSLKYTSSLLLLVLKWRLDRYHNSFYILHIVYRIKI